MTTKKQYAEADYASHITPCANRVVILPEKAEEKSDGGIILPGVAQRQKNIGHVVCAHIVDGMQFNAGDRVVFDVGPDIVHQQVDVLDETLLIVEAMYIAAKLKDGRHK